MTLNGPDPSVYAARRAALLERLEDAVLFIPGVPEAVYAADVHYPYRPDTNARYLSGFEEPAALILCRHGGDGAGFTLCVEPRDAHSETWTGLRAGLEGARSSYGADHAHALAETFDVLLGQLRHANTLYFVHSRDNSTNGRVLELVRQINGERPRSGRPPLVVDDGTSLVGEMRWRKSAEEVALLRKACRISATAHRSLLETVKPGMYEYEVEAALNADFRRAGCTGPAYGTIAAGGTRATVLHYTRNDQELEDGDLLLVDAGGEYGGYAADITRTFPVGRTFTPGQADLYDLVLAAQTAAIDTVRPGATMDSVHQAAVEVLAAGLVTLGWVEGDTRECLANGSYKAFYMHNTSHWLGMDVHDTGSYRSGDASRTLEPGAVLTVEPGLYVRADADVGDVYAGTGIRIEDDVLVTEDGAEVLTSAAPKERAEIERYRRG